MSQCISSCAGEIATAGPSENKVTNISCRCLGNPCPLWCIALWCQTLVGFQVGISCFQSIRIWAGKKEQSFCAWWILHKLGAFSNPSFCAWSGRDPSQNLRKSAWIFGFGNSTPWKLCDPLEFQGFCAWSGRDPSQNGWLKKSSILCMNHHSQKKTCDSLWNFPNFVLP